jgi:hypothetical protein
MGQAFTIGSKIMLCCEMKSNVSDKAGLLRETALQEVKQKKIIANTYLLTKCANPYAVDNVVVVKAGNDYRVFYCGDLVYLTVNNNLRRYVCGDWTDILSNEAAKIRNQRKEAEAGNRRQLLANDIAEKNFVVC